MNLSSAENLTAPSQRPAPPPRSGRQLLPDDKTAWRCALFSLLLFVLFVIVVLALRYPAIQALDRAYSTILVDWGGKKVTRIAVLFAWLGSKGLYLAIPLIGILAWRVGKLSALKTFAVILLGHCLLLCTKSLVKRPRPDSRSLTKHLDSFPSGHTLIAIVLWGSVLIFLLPVCKQGWQRFLLWTGAIVWPVLMGLSRLQMGRHYIGDVVASWLLGTAWLLLCAAALRWKKKTSETSRTQVAV